MTETTTQTPPKTAAKASAAAAKKAGPGRYIESLGKRKTSGARVRLYDNGTGTITVNDKAFTEYFPSPLDQTVLVQPLKAAAFESRFDITVKVAGGGKRGQAAAVRHGIARCLLAFDKDLRGILKSNNWLTRDARKKERKKPGLKKARRAPQWSKR